MIKIGLDLAYRSCGIAIITDTKLYHTSIDLSKRKLHCSYIVSQMADWVLSEIQPYLSLPHILVMEEIFKGPWESLKQMARAQGAVMDRYTQKTGKNPELVSAIIARNKVNIPPQAPKVAIQLWALATFKLQSSLDREYRDKVEETVKTYYALLAMKRKVNKKRLKSVIADLKKQTNKVAELTGIDNHASDAMVLALGAET